MGIRPCEECLPYGEKDVEWLDDGDRCPDCGRKQPDEEVKEGEKIMSKELSNIVNEKDQGYSLATIGAEFGMFGDDPKVFIEKLEREYLSNLTFQQAARFLMEYINKNHHPMTTIIIEHTNAQIFESQESYNTEEFLRD